MVLATTLRSIQSITTADTLLPDPTISALQSADTGGAARDPASLIDVATDPVSTTANEAVLATHASLEGAADQNGTAGSVHGLTNLGETIGLGHLGQDNLLTGIQQTPGNMLAGDPATALGEIASGAVAVAAAAPGLPEGAADDLGANRDLVGAAGAPPMPAFATDPIAQSTNTDVLAFHGAIEGAADANGTSGTVHGVTGAGETLGLGHLGSPGNLLTDTLDAPSAALSGNTGPLSGLPSDLAHEVGALGNLAKGVGSDAGSGMFLSNPVGNALILGQGLAALPVAALAAGSAGPAVATAGSLEASALGGSMVGGGLTDALTHPTTGAGILGGDLPGQGILQPVAVAGYDALGEVGSTTGTGPIVLVGDGTAASGLNLVGDTLHAPADVLDELATGAAPLAGDAAATASSVGGIVQAAGSTLAGPAAATSGDLAVLASHGDAAAGTVGTAGAAIGSGLQAMGTSALADTQHLAGDAVAGTTATVTAVVQDASTAAGHLATGATAQVAQLGSLAGSEATSAATAASSLVHGAAAQASGPIGDAVHAVSTLAGTTVAAAENGLAGNAGSHDAATVGFGGSGSSSGTSFDVLTTNGSNSVHLVEIHGGTAGAPMPVLANVNVLPDTLHFPAPAGGGDALSGVLAPVSGAVAAHGGDVAPAPVVHDAGLAHFDVPVAHADPLHALAHAAHA